MFSIIDIVQLVIQWPPTNMIWVIPLKNESSLKIILFKNWKNSHVRRFLSSTPWWYEARRLKTHFSTHFLSKNGVIVQISWKANSRNSNSARKYHRWFEIWRTIFGKYNTDGWNKFVRKMEFYEIYDLWNCHRRGVLSIQNRSTQFGLNSSVFSK